MSNWLGPRRAVCVCVADLHAYALLTFHCMGRYAQTKIYQGRPVYRSQPPPATTADDDESRHTTTTYIYYSQNFGSWNVGLKVGGTEVYCFVKSVADVPGRILSTEVILRLGSLAVANAVC